MSCDMPSTFSDPLYERLLELKALYHMKKQSVANVSDESNTSAPNTPIQAKRDAQGSRKGMSIQRSPSPIKKEIQDLSKENSPMRRKRRKSLESEISKSPSHVPQDDSRARRNKRRNGVKKNVEPKPPRLEIINFDLVPDDSIECNQCRTKASSRWYLGPHQEQWHCKRCGEDWSRYNACPICGLVYEEDKKKLLGNEDDDESEEESNSWIECEQCGRWVMTKCDGISDLSLYADSNPNHLPYECPLCVGKLDCLPRIFYKKSDAYLFEGFVSHQMALKESAKLYDEKLFVSRAKLLSKEKEITNGIANAQLEKEIKSYREQLAVTWNNILDCYERDYQDQEEHLRKERSRLEMKVEHKIMCQYESFLQDKLIKHNINCLNTPMNKET